MLHRPVVILAAAVVTATLAAAALGRPAMTPAKLQGTVGPGFTISLKSHGTKVKTLKAGAYTFVVADKGSIHNFVILEGVSASREAFRPFLTYSIWIEAPADVRLSRGLERDGEGARAKWEEWMAQEDRYIERERPHERVDLVVSGASARRSPRG